MKFRAVAVGKAKPHLYKGGRYWHARLGRHLWPAGDFLSARVVAWDLHMALKQAGGDRAAG